MVIIILEDSTEAIRVLVELYRSKKNPGDELYVFACPGGAFVKSDFEELERANLNEADIHFFRYEDVDKLIKDICAIAKRNAGNTRIAIDVSIFHDNGLQYKDFQSIFVARSVIKSNAIESDKLTFYSTWADREMFEKQLPGFKRISRPDVFNESNGSVFYAKITGR